jgi:hypothetical protein
MDYNWLSPKAEARPAGGKGWGSFALETIPAGETVAAFGGWIVTGAYLEGLSDDRQSRSIQVDSDLYLLSGDTPEPGDMLNHSCEPNCGLVGQTLLVAMRDIAPGEEMCFDYAMCDASDYDEFRCLCGASTCRESVTGSDWRNPDLQTKYYGWFSPYIARRIAALPAQG